MCVQTANYNSTKGVIIDSPIEIGSEYIAIGELHEQGVVAYFLEGFNLLHAFDVNLFAILADLSADDLQEQERECIVNLENAVV